MEKGKIFEVVFEDSKENITYNEMTTAQDKSYVSYAKDNVPKGTKIVGFRMKVDSHTYELTVDDGNSQKYYEIKGTKSGVNLVFTTQDDGTTAKYTSGE